MSFREIRPKKNVTKLTDEERSEIKEIFITWHGRLSLLQVCLCIVKAYGISLSTAYRLHNKLFLNLPVESIKETPIFNLSN